jgi:DNA-binding transcriptional MerR regulator
MPRSLDLSAGRRLDGGEVGLTIGECARRAEVSVDALRFYERRGVLPRPRRRPSGYRIYAEADVARVRMTKSLQRLGFNLDEVVEALAAFEEGKATCASERWRLEAVLGRIDRKIHELEATRADVVATLALCRADTCKVMAPASSRSPLPKSKTKTAQH